MMAVTTVLTLPVILLFFLTQRTFIQGIPFSRLEKARRLALDLFAPHLGKRLPTPSAQCGSVSTTNILSAVWPHALNRCPTALPTWRRDLGLNQKYWF
jgi:hypothetical protein